MQHLPKEIKMLGLKAASTVLAALTLAVAAQTATAQARINSITADRTEAVLEGGRAVIKFTIDGDAPEDSNCGIYVEYSGTDTPDNRKLNSKDGLFPKVIEHSFTRAGNYNVEARGRKVGATLGCLGQAKVAIAIREAPKAAAAQARAAGAGASAKRTPVCGEGWRLVQTKAGRKSGAYTCKPKKGVTKAPETRAECPAGLVYFEKGATFGCGK